MSINRVLSFLAIAVLAVAACTSSAGGATSGGGASNGGGTTTTAAIVGSESSPTFGMVLTGPNGMTLYTHAGDSATSSTCTGACATAWPPLETKGQPTAKAGITGQLGTRPAPTARPRSHMAVFRSITGRGTRRPAIRPVTVSRASRSRWSVGLLRRPSRRSRRQPRASRVLAASTGTRSR